ncbi:MAG: CRISPR-associated helicase/endonuclease Cas3, partial [Planctomycetota bacterium]
HLSSAMCPAHRSKVLEDVTDRLEADRACRLISTQVVEAGVDIDFPVLYRAAAPLDSIVQAAGRCNREGALDKGRAIVFEPRDGGMPPGAYRTAAEVTRMMLQDLDVSALENAPVFRDYFSRLYDVLNTDQKDILDKRARMDYPAVAEAYNLINSDTRPVIVKWGKGAEIPAQMRDKPYLSRRDFAIIQRYSVNMWSYQLKKALKRGLCAEIRSGLYEWCGKYDPNTGVLMESQDPEDFIC